MKKRSVNKYRYNFTKGGSSCVPLLMIVISLMSNAGLAQEEKILIEVSGIDVERGGNLIVLVFSSDGFPVKHEKAFLTQTTEISGERMSFAFNAPVPAYAELAFKVLHDQDANNKVTKNWTGIWPAEGLGFSNGTKMRAVGPPGFEEAKLSRDQAMSGVKVRLIYP